MTENKEKQKRYIDFSFPDYAMARILHALDSCGVKDFAITLEDNDLHIRIDKDIIDRLYYRSYNCTVTKCNEMECVNKTKKGNK